MEKKLYQDIVNIIYKKSTLESIVTNLERIKEKLAGNKKISQEKVEEIVEKEVINKELKALLQEHIREGNFSIFNEKQIASLLGQIEDLTNTAKLIDISIAIPLIESDVQEIAHMLEEKIQKKVILNLKVDIGLIGGVVIKENKYIYDASLRNHLKAYENVWIRSITRKQKKIDS